MKSFLTFFLQPITLLLCILLATFSVPVYYYRHIKLDIPLFVTEWIKTGLISGVLFLFMAWLHYKLLVQSRGSDLGEYSSLIIGKIIELKNLTEDLIRTLNSITREHGTSSISTNDYSQKLHSEIQSIVNKAGDIDILINSISTLDIIDQRYFDLLKYEWTQFSSDAFKSKIQKLIPFEALNEQLHDVNDWLTKLETHLTTLKLKYQK